MRNNLSHLLQRFGDFFYLRLHGHDLLNLLVVLLLQNHVLLRQLVALDHLLLRLGATQACLTCLAKLRQLSDFLLLALSVEFKLLKHESHLSELHLEALDGRFFVRVFALVSRDEEGLLFLEQFLEVFDLVLADGDRGLDLAVDSISVIFGEDRADLSLRNVVLLLQPHQLEHFLQ